MSNLLASELYAIAHETKCEGEEKCHWCTAPCKRLWLHDDPIPIPFARSKSFARFYQSAYICVGCWLYRRKRTTIHFLEGDFKDGRCASDYSWMITKDQKLAIRNPCVSLYNTLLKPPLCFSLSLIEDNVENLLQFAVVNDLSEIKNDTPLLFTVNNKEHKYTTYELEQTLKSGDATGKDPGVAALLRILGLPPKIISLSQEEKKERGRPIKGDPRPLNKAIRMSGAS